MIKLTGFFGENTSPQPFYVDHKHIVSIVPNSKYESRKEEYKHHALCNSTIFLNIIEDVPRRIYRDSSNSEFTAVRLARSYNALETVEEIYELINQAKGGE